VRQADVAGGAELDVGSRRRALRPRRLRRRAAGEAELDVLGLEAGRRQAIARGLAGRAEQDIAAVAGAGRGRARRGGRRHRARRRRRAGGLAAEVAQLLEGADDRLELLRARLQPELDLRPLDQTADVALAVHRARDGVLDLVEAE